ncbi:hypothetical protein SAMD00019534_017750 [Acytostelium subglobosum LB1]|uniref:hypothetical protein n=1 Tax=Acytostelium subglobosum LB1 TaxID=1410327 RepID=UPI000644DB97|nr:hypothetical protein SAMD00019534_017750 [Acytostelium subglobosum LB1]GAM18600.1 hypothetical protein SAMD00019534_017750 [Acytostelium subglobosum LB1]|eukprot:XP_012757820.1 hypothetical protein SAMD00019534_017750 [Acytostelium subglobosum LB1]
MSQLFIYASVLLLLLLLPSANVARQTSMKDSLKAALLLSGNFRDVGFNYACNQAFMEMESALQLNGRTRVVNDINSYEQTTDAINALIRDGFNFIIGSSIEHMGSLNDNAPKNPDAFFLVRWMTTPAAPNIRNIFIDFGIGHYLQGYFAALQTKTQQIGIITPGPPAFGYVTANSFYLGAMAYNDKVKVHSIETGSWNPDIEIAEGATNYLIDLGVDVLTNSQDDLTVQQVASLRNTTSFGTSGASISKLLGSTILTSIITNWAPCYLAAAKDIVEGNWNHPTGLYNNIGVYFGTLAEGGIKLDTPYSYMVSNDTISKMDTLMTKLKNISQEDQPYTFNPIYAESPYNSSRLNEFILLKSEFLLPGVVNHHRYVIPPTEYKVTNSIKYGFSITAGIVGFLALLIMIALVIFRKTNIMRSASPLFCILIVFGGMLIYTGVILWVQDPTAALCRARVWMLSLGYTILLGNMVIKNFRIWLIFDNPHLKRLKITNAKLFPWLCGIVLINCTILAAWTGVGEINANPFYGFEGIRQYDYRTVCDSNHDGNTVLYILLIYHAVLLVIGCFVSWKIRVVDISEFNESKPIANTLYAISFCLFIIIPLMVAQQNYDGKIIIICASAIFTTASALAILFVPKFWRLYTKGLDADPFSSSKSLSFGNSTMQRGNFAGTLGASEMESLPATNTNNSSAGSTTDHKSISAQQDLE